MEIIYALYSVLKGAVPINLPVVFNCAYLFTKVPH